MTLRDIDAQIAEVQRRRDEAVRLEQERLARENAHKQKLREAEEELARLEGQRANARFDEAIAANPGLIAENRKAVDALLAVLDNPTGPTWFDDIDRAMAAVNASYERQEQHRQNTLAAIEAHVYRDWPKNWDALDIAQQRVYEEPKRREAGGYRNRFMGAHAWPAGVALSHWIARAADDRQRRQRSGIAYSITGQLWTNTSDYNPDRAVEGHLQAQEARRF